jgi:hypothetical protein
MTLPAAKLLAAVAYAAGNVPYISGALFLSGLAEGSPGAASW